MATSYFFHYVSVVIGTANPHILQSVRSNMWHLGCREITYTQDPAQLETLIATTSPDLVLCDAALMPDKGIAKLLRRIRHGELGRNPFLPLIGLVDHAHPAAVRALADAGADDVVPHPWTPGYLDQRILKLINQRRPFVVTADYVGPDRRQTARSASGQPPTLVVPNTLRARAVDRTPPDALIEQIRDGALTVTITKIQRLAELAQRLVSELSGLQARTDVVPEVLSACLTKLREAILGIARRAPQTRYSNSVETCRILDRTIKVMATSLEQGISPELILLSPLTERLATECGLSIIPADDQVSVMDPTRSAIETVQLRAAE